MRQRKGRKLASTRVFAVFVALTMLMLSSYSVLGLEISRVPDPNSVTDEGSGDGEGTAGDDDAVSLGLSLPEESDFESIPYTPRTSSKIRGARSATTDSHAFYQQLNDATAEDAYRQIVAALSNGETNRIEITYTTLRKTGVAPADGQAAVNELSAQAQSAAKEALETVLRDCPEFYWVFGQGMGIAATDLTYPIDPNTGTLTVSIGGAYIDLGATDTLSDQSAINKAVANYKSKANQKNSKYDKLRVVFEELAKNIDYRDTGYRAHQISGALIDGECVCEGYAKSFKVICDELGIPCVLVSGYAGEDHMWNYVKMDDSKWYAVDVTWYNPNMSDRTDYFLVGSTTVIDGERFGDTRTISGQFSENGRDNYTYPALSDKAYVPGTDGDGNGDGGNDGDDGNGSKPGDGDGNGSKPGDGDGNKPGDGDGNNGGDTDKNIATGKEGTDFANVIAAQKVVSGFYTEGIKITADSSLSYSKVSTSPNGPFTDSITITQQANNGSMTLYYQDPDTKEIVKHTFTYSLDTSDPVYNRSSFSRSSWRLTVNATDEYSGIASIVVTDPDGKTLEAVSGYNNVFTATMYGRHTITITDKVGRSITKYYDVTEATGTSGAVSGSGNGGTNLRTSNSGGVSVSVSGAPTGSIKVGESFTLTPQPADVQTGSAGWTWDKEMFSATFNSPATFTALKPGTSTITYTSWSGQSFNVTVTVVGTAAGGNTSSGSGSGSTGGVINDNPDTGR